MLGNNNIPPDDIPSDNDIPVRDRPPLHRIADENEDSLKVALKFEDWTGFVLMTTNFPSDAPYSVLARAVATALPFLPFQMKMRKLYGFCPTSRPYDDIAKPSSNLLGEKVVEDARKTLGDGSTPLDFDLETMRHLCNFATALSDLDFTRGDLLGALWDIDRSHPEYLWKFKSTVTATPANLEFDGKTSTFYKLEVRGEQGFPVDIFAADPIIALACMRMNFASGSDVLRFLLTQGCSFYTSSSRLTSVRNSCDVPIVGWREVNYKPDLADYAVYELRVQALMEHRAAAALLKGGLYWRLAMYYSKDVVSIDKALAYTSKAVAPLSANEEDILIGKYNIYTVPLSFWVIVLSLNLRFTGRGEQVASSSWWPRYNATKNTFLNAGYWTPSCEVWFRNNLQSIVTLKRGLKTSLGWKHSTRQLMSAYRFTSRQREYAHRYLSRTVSGVAG